MRTKLRPEVLVMPSEDGGLDLYDLLYERITSLSPQEAIAFDAGEDEVVKRLEALVLLEGEHADTLRRQRYARHKAEVPLHPAPEVEEVDWSLATRWPTFISAHWRDGRALRQLAESRAAGNSMLSLTSFLTRESALELLDATKALEFERMDTPWVKASRHALPARSPLTRWTDFLAREDTRMLFGAILARPLSATITGNVWRLDPGDMMPVHNDGRRYHGTCSLGLSRQWSASQGGAIAFGAPEGKGFKVHTRWLPHLGDLLLFAPRVDSWHAVEPVISGQRTSLTTWWTAA